MRQLSITISPISDLLFLFWIQLEGNEKYFHSIENEEKLVYLKGRLGEQLLSVTRTLPLSNTGNRQ
jgi:hypothetical protein